MHLTTKFLLLLAYSLAADAAPQRRQAKAYPPLRDRANAVKEAFDFSWAGYIKYATNPDPNAAIRLHDELHPIDHTVSDSRNGWGASAIDALTTAIVMKNADAVNTILDHIAKVNYTKNPTPSTVSLFETTIRYLGGMISGYDLLGPKGPAEFRSLLKNPKSADVLLVKSMELANSLKYAFAASKTNSGIPYNDLVFPDKFDAPPGSALQNGLATTGTLVLEWTRLSDISGVPEYGALAQKAEQYLLNPKLPYPSPGDGLVGDSIYVDNGTFVNARGGWGGGTDSFYEYLIKMYVYDPKRFGLYRDRWIAAAESSMKRLASHPVTKPELTFLAGYNGTNLALSSGHLACFDGGNFLLGGSVLGRKDILDFGLELTKSCYATYSSTETGIGPEFFVWDQRAPVKSVDFFNKNGFWIPEAPFAAAYDLRPEVLESIYYASRLTGNPMYQDWAWKAFLAINSTCRATYGFSAIKDVTQPKGGGFENLQESFWFAEVMKYLYMIFTPDVEGHVAPNGQKNKWVYNTEAHPIRVFE